MALCRLTWICSRSSKRLDSNRLAISYISCSVKYVVWYSRSTTLGYFSVPNASRSQSTLGSLLVSQHFVPRPQMPWTATTLLLTDEVSKNNKRKQVATHDIEG